MTRTLLLQLSLAGTVFFVGVVAVSAQAKDPNPSPSPEQVEQKKTEEDRIYAAKEVDVRAKPIRSSADYPSPGADCPGRVEFLAAAGAVLRKSGKVTDVELLKSSGCKTFDEDVGRVLRNLRFNPALKDDLPVSQYQRFEFQHFRY